MQYLFRLMRPLLGLLLLFLALRLGAQVPHACDGDIFLTRLASGENSSRLFKVAPDKLTDPAAWTRVATFQDRRIGPIGFRVIDNLVYALDTETLDLLTVDANGDIQLRANLKSGLDTTLSYHAGGITPFGKYFILIGRDPFTGYDQDLFRVRLDRPDFNIGVTAMLPPTEVQVDDLAFSPIYGTMVGYDALNRTLVDIRQISGLVSDFSFQSQGQIGRLGGLFYDRAGQLYGYGNSGGTQDNFLYRLNALNGVAEEVGVAATSRVSDACACPYTIPFTKSYSPNPALDCDEIRLTYRWTSLAGTSFREVSLRDTLPPGIRALSVLHSPQPLTQALVPGSNLVDLRFQDLLLGTDSVVIVVEVDETQALSPAGTGYMGPLPLAYEGAVQTTWADTKAGLETAPLSVQIVPESTSLCAGSSNRLEARTDLASDRISYFWNTGDTTASIEIAESGQYVVDVQAGCEVASDTIVIGSQGQAARLDLGPDIEIVQGASVALAFTSSALPPYQLLWSNSGGVAMSCTDCPNPSTRPLTTTRYVLTLQEPSGCAVSDSMVVSVSENRAILIPNVFSPNADGINDQFYVSGRSFATLTRMELWDRLGRQVFSRNGGAVNDAALGWNGSFRGKPATAGVYYYAITLTFPDEEVRHYQGSVSLLR